MPASKRLTTWAMGNIQRVVPVDLSNGDYENETGFFIRVETDGYLTYLPKNNEDNEPITKHFDASNIFVDPEIIRKIFALGVTSPEADGIYAGFGV